MFLLFLLASITLALAVFGNMIKDNGEDLDRQ